MRKTTGHFDSVEMLELWVCDLKKIRGPFITNRRIAEICGVKHFHVAAILRENGWYGGRYVEKDE